MKIETNKTYTLTLSEKEIIVIANAVDFAVLGWNERDSELPCANTMLDQFIAKEII